MNLNNIFAHQEDSSKDGFTGEWASDRAVAVGYHSNQVGENITTARDEIESIDLLFSAIYHRFGFLSFMIDEVGMGVDNFKDKKVYTYNMGIKNANNYKNYPDFITFPASGMVDVLPVFYSEIPDPLPNYYMSANPISIQFNPKFANTDISIEDFSIKPIGGEALDVISLDKTTDPNGRFDNLEFAFFPIKRLDYNTTYKVVITYKASSQIKQYDFNFTTRSYPNLITVQNNKTYTLKKNTIYYIYFETTKDQAMLSKSESAGYKATKPSTFQEDIDIIDSMTYKVAINGNSGDFSRIDKKTINFLKKK